MDKNCRWLIYSIVIEHFYLNSLELLPIFELVLWWVAVEITGSNNEFSDNWMFVTEQEESAENMSPVFNKIGMCTPT